jgi:hypothetical protein
MNDASFSAVIARVAMRGTMGSFRRGIAASFKNLFDF